MQDRQISFWKFIVQVPRELVRFCQVQQSIKGAGTIYGRDTKTDPGQVQLLKRDIEHKDSCNDNHSIEFAVSKYNR